MHDAYPTYFPTVHRRFYDLRISHVSLCRTRELAPLTQVCTNSYVFSGSRGNRAEHDNDDEMEKQVH